MSADGSWGPVEGAGMTSRERFIVDRALPGITLLLLSAHAARTHGRIVPHAVLAGVAALAFGDAVKAIVRRPRPRVGPASGPQRYSFPSTHAAVAIAVTTAGTAGASLRLTLSALAAVAGAALGRVREGRHHASDVLAGAAIGAAAGVVARRFAGDVVIYDPVEV